MTVPANPPELFGDIGSVKEGIRALLLGPDFERKLVAVEARFADGLTLPRLTDAVVKTSEIESIPSQYPWCELVCERSDADNEVEFADKNTHSVSILFWMNGDDEQTVTKLVERYILAARKLIRCETLMPFIGSLPIVRATEQYGLVGKKPDASPAFVKAGSITFSITTIEA